MTVGCCITQLIADEVPTIRNPWLVLPQSACNFFFNFFVLGFFNTYGSRYNNTGKGPE